MSYRKTATPGRDWVPAHVVLMGLGWTPGPGQTPADDPRMVKAYAIVRSTYRPHNISSSQTTRAADQLLERARSVFAGNNVRKIGSTGWTSQGTVGYEVVLASATRAGEIKRKNYEVGQYAGPRVADGSSFDNALTFINAADFAEPAASDSPIPHSDGAPPDAAIPDASANVDGGFFEQEVGGIPVWMIGGLGVVAVGGIALVLLMPKKKPAVATANRRRARRRRRAA